MVSDADTFAKKCISCSIYFPTVSHDVNLCNNCSDVLILPKKKSDKIATKNKSQFIRSGYFEMVKIVWDDAGQFSSYEQDSVWHTVESIIELYQGANFTNISVGFLVYENDKDIVIAQSKAEEKKHDLADKFSNLLRIPKGMVLSVTTIEES